MSARSHVWTWPIATYLFLGGMGAGMTIIAAVLDVFFGCPLIAMPCAIGAIVALGLGSALLIFELGRPFQFWRVFSTEKAVLTFGAWMIVLLVIVDFVYFTGWFEAVPWSGVTGLRIAAAVIGMLLGFGVLLYTGIELSSMKARVFWNSPGLPVLFALSGLLAGAAGDYLVISVWPYGTDLASSTLSSALDAATVLSGLTVLLAALGVFTLLSTVLYAVLMLTSSSSSAAREAAARWISGKYSMAFWGGLVIVGLVIPLVALLFGGIANAIACVLFIVGGVFLRFLVVYNDDRRKVNGEALHDKRLPNGNEPFLKAKWERSV